MATSSQAATVPFALTSIDEGSPIATWIVRDGLIETINHLADEQAQPRINWMAADSALLSGTQDQYLTTATPTATGEYTRIAAFGPFPLSIMPDGNTPYKLRILIAGASSAGDSVEFGVTIAEGLVGSESDISEGTADETKKFDAVTSTTPAWLTPTNGSNVWAANLAVASAGLRYYSTHNDSVAPYDIDASIQQTEVFFDVWCKTANTSSSGRLYALHVAEVIGT